MKLRVLVPRYRAQKWVFIPILILAAWGSIHGLMPFAVMVAELVRGPALPALSDYTRAKRPSYSTSASSVGNASKRVRWRALFFLNSLLAHPKPEIPLTSPGDNTKIIIIWLCQKLSNSMSLRGVKKITLLVIASPEGAKQSHKKSCRGLIHQTRTIIVRLPRFARNGRLPRPFRARNDIVKIYIAFILVLQELTRVFLILLSIQDTKMHTELVSSLT